MAGLSVHPVPPASVIVILGLPALPTAQRIKDSLPGAQIHGLSKRMVRTDGVDQTFADLSSHLQHLYRLGHPIIGLCAAGILIRSLATCIGATVSPTAEGANAIAGNGSGADSAFAGSRVSKCIEPPLLAVAMDGSAVVPLLGGLAGVNTMARIIAAALAVRPAITTTGELRFGTCLLNPPEGYRLADIDVGKRFVSDLLAGEATRVESATNVPWLEDIDLPKAADAALRIRVSVQDATDAHTLLIHPRALLVAFDASLQPGASLNADAIVECVSRTLMQRGLAPLALAALILDAQHIGDEAAHAAALRLHVPVRFVNANSTPDAQRLLETACSQVWPNVSFTQTSALADAVSATATSHKPSKTAPEDVAVTILDMPLSPSELALLGRKRGSLSVVGIGPGDKALLAPAAQQALANADDILGYTTYTAMAGPYLATQIVHGTDNREEMQRARHAFELADTGRDVVMVSSGDPGVFAMASAVLEALDDAQQGDNATNWSSVQLRIIPGISAAMATAAVAGAPLGHDFCVLSLSDNLKPWAVIESRLRLAAQADLVIALYNPVSKARPWQLGRALEILRAERDTNCLVTLGRDVGRPGASLRTLPLHAVQSDMVDMRTMLIVGSSTTRQFDTRHGKPWVYTPRWYPTAPH